MRINHNGFSYRIQIWQPPVKIVFLSTICNNTNVWTNNGFIQLSEFWSLKDAPCKGLESPWVVHPSFGYGQGLFHWPDSLNLGLCQHLLLF